MHIAGTGLAAALFLAAELALPTMASAANTFSAVYVMSDNLGDKGFNDSTAAGLRRAEKEGVRIKLLQASPSDPQLWRQNLEATSDSGAWSVIFTGPGMHDNLAAVAPKHPHQKYVYFDDELKLPNVVSIKYAQNEGSYLAGGSGRADRDRQAGVSAVEGVEESRTGRRSGSAGDRGLHRRLQAGSQDNRSIDRCLGLVHRQF